MNNMGFFNPFGSSGSGGGGGGGGSTANYSVKTFTDSSGQVSYKLTKNGTAVGDVISFNGSNMLVNYGGELVVFNSAIASIEEALDKTYNFTTFTELGINTQNKTLSQLSAELAAKNLEEDTVVTGRVYSEALPYNNYGNAEVLVNNSILWWKTSSSTISPYSWNAIVVGNTVKMDWTPTYYQLPIASAQSLGGVKIGDNVQIAPDGTISVITTKGDTGTGIASIAKTSSSGLNDIYTITYTDSTTSTFTVTNGATITGGSIGQTGHLILTMSDGRTIDTGALPTDNEVEVTTTSSQPADPNVELWVDLSTQQTLDIPEINDSSTSSTQDTWSCKKIYDEQQRQDALEAVDRAALTKVIDGGAAGTKNLLDCSLQSIKAVTQNPSYGFSWNGNVCTSTRGVSFTINADNSITVAANTQDEVWFKLTDFMYSAGSYVISGCPTNGSTSSYYIESDALNYRDIGNGVSFTINSTTTDSIYIVVRSGQTFEKTFYPMLCSKVLCDADPSYVPYAPALTNIILTPAVIKAVDEGAKNHLYCDMSVMKSVNTNGTWSGSSFAHNSGVTFTVNNDSSITVNGTASDVNGVFVLSTDFTISQGDWILSGTPSGGGSSTYNISIAGIISDIGNTARFSSATNKLVRIFVIAGTTINNLLFKPMICTAADYAVSPKFVPYRPSWQEMWEMIQALQNNS